MRRLGQIAAVLTLVLLYQNCQNGGFDSLTDSQGSNSQGGLGPDVQASASSDAQVDCSRSGASIQVSVAGTSGNILICTQYSYELPVGSPHYAESFSCGGAGGFSVPDSSWQFNSSSRAWSKTFSPISSYPSLLPGTYRFFAKDNQGLVGSSAQIRIARSGYANCTPSTSPPGGGGSGATGVPENGFDPGLDPGFLKGTWAPKGTTRFWVVDQSYPQIQGGFTYFPGCVNQVMGSWSCPSYLGGINLYKSGTILSIRYRTLDKTPASAKLVLSAGTGSGIPAPLTITFTSRPGDFSSSVPSSCRSSGAMGMNPQITFASNACQTVPNHIYYLNVRTDSDCLSEGTCRFMAIEPAGIAN